MNAGLVLLIQSLTILTLATCSKVKSEVRAKVSGQELVTHITKFSPTVAKPGDEVTVSGTNLVATRSYEVSLKLANGSTKSIAMQVTNQTTGKFVMPEGAGLGLKSVDVYQSKSKIANIELVADQNTNTLSIYTGDASSICSTVSFINKSGETKTGTKDCGSGTVADCKSDGEIGCKTVASFPAANASGALAANIKSGVTIAGVAGSLASSYSNCTADGQSGCIATTAFKSADTSVAIAGNIKSGATIAGIAGTVIAAPANCSADGTTGCVTTSTFKSADTSVFTAKDLRNGKTVAGVSGALKANCRNTISNSKYNFDGALGSIPDTAVTTGTTLDIWDTIDDYYGLTADTPWSSSVVCDSGNWTDVTTSDGGTTTTTCAADSANCQYEDTTSHLVVTKLIASGEFWGSAFGDCYNSTYGGFAAHTWRLPTQKELMSLYVDGIASLASANFISLANMQSSVHAVWSATSSATNTANAIGFKLANGFPLVGMKNNDTMDVLCVR